MASKQLTAKVRLDISQAEKAIAKLESRIKSMNTAATRATRTSSAETQLKRQMEMADKLAQKELNAVHKKQQAKWKAFQQEQAAYDKAIQKEAALAQKAMDTERARQQSLKTLAAGDRAAQRLAVSAEKTRRKEYERWWQEQLINHEVQKTQTHLDRARASVERVSAKVREWWGSQKGITSNLLSNNTILGSIWTKLKGIAATYLGIMGAKAAISTTDMLVGAQNRINYINGGDSAATEEALDKMYASAQRARTSYGNMISNVSKTMALAGDAFGNNIDNAIRFQETMAKAYSVGGATASEMHSSMYQMTQALASGILAGDELRSVREGAPLAYKAIEKFAQGVNNSTDSLKEMASNGLITSDIVVAAIMDMGESIDTAFANTRQTFAQTFDQIKNTATYAFKPVMEMLTDKLNEFIENGMIAKCEVLFNNLAKVAMIVFRIIEIGVDWVVEHWTTINKVIMTTVVIIGSILIPVLINWLNTVVASTMAALAGIWADILAFIELAKAEGFAATMGALFGITINWWLIAIIAVIALVVIAVIWLADSFADACGIIVGTIMVAVAFVWNLIVGVINAIIQFVWSYFVEPWIGIIEFVLNALNGGFNSFEDGVRNLLGNIISWFLSLGQVVTTIIDAIFGTNWTSGLEKMKAELVKSGKNESAITISREAPSLKDMGMDRWAYGDAYSTGYDWGYGAVDGLGISLDSIGNALGLDFSDMTTPFPDDGLDTTLAGIKDDTGKISDSMELTQEDLEYLRRVAEMEWKKEFTTASIKLDVTNNNSVNSELDIFGIATKIGEALYEEMDYLANGVYAY